MQSPILIVKKRKQIDFPMVMASGIYLSAHTNDSNRAARDVSHSPANRQPWFENVLFYIGHPYHSQLTLVKT